ncbi:MAG: hydantoinase/oxoprolinase family protein [Alphaproteobacteria bacterium]|jgi:N-methylhydantoinase A|nr:hydantoinase/oxoprolinase family protein [Alphaproteobacteria bacterium]
MSGPRWIIGVDVGGTFTDVFALEQATGQVLTAKTPSTPADQSIGFVRGLGLAAPLADIGTVVHGTTVGTNALLERKGARTGLIATEGFRDVLEMRRRDRPHTWGLRGTFKPVAARQDRLEVRERTLADGTIEQAVDEAGVEAAARALADAGCESVAIAFVNAYANPENEQRARAAVARVWPNAHITAATDILPEIREFERTSTAVLNAYLQPTMGRYINRLHDALAAGGDAGLLIVQSNGGLMTAAESARAPIRTALSGPAAGVVAAQRVGVAAGYPNIIACDMGGTSFDVSLIADGQTALAAETSIDFGMTARAPMVEIVTIGAGGGSIAWVDAGGMLRIGPESAGADPGPVAYGKGGTRPTVTDANIVLGRINPERPIGGELSRLDTEAARAALQATIGDALGLDPEQAAEAVIRVANARMAGAIRLVSIERGHDPKSFLAMPFGGGGALHAGALVNEVGLAGAISPRYPGVLSALGCVIADMRRDFVQTINRPLPSLDTSVLTDAIAAYWRDGTAALDDAGVALDARRIEIELDMHYQGQTHAIPVRIASTDDVSRLEINADSVQSAFEAAYLSQYGRLLDGPVIRVMNLRAAVIGVRPRFDLTQLAPDGGDIATARTGSRPVYVDGAWTDATIYDRLALPVGAVINGPAVLEQPDATIFVEPDLSARVDSLGNVILERQA